MNDSIFFPPHFVALKKYPGYFWHEEEKRLYSLKQTGVLTPLKPRNLSRRESNIIERKTGYWFPSGVDIYRVSKAGKSKNIVANEIGKYLSRPYVVPVQLKLF